MSFCVRGQSKIYKSFQGQISVWDIKLKLLQQTQQMSSPVEQINENAVAGCLIAKDELSIEELTFDTKEKKCRGCPVGS
ncbi:hypothetical protein TSAR_006158 [Trichomalopsis sarcophagae]|uniref:Uncharacterized protein n=1 Tax=Trichomalopsis sarcophagae TaxID=543379 RepID=A0A232F0I4_9HYME|nr:hypothetical protein TSAR_006158 [Trichomalopsis sarcophagae]